MADEGNIAQAADGDGGNANSSEGQAPAQPPVSGAGEQKAYEKAPTPPENFPEKFLKDGSPDYNALVSSYSEMERMVSGRREELLEQLRNEMSEGKDVPESADAYEPPELETWDKETMTSDPMYNWWKQKAFDSGYSNEEFQAIIKEYAEMQASNGPNEKEEKAKLGDNADARINAVANWMDRFSDNPTVYNQLDKLAFTAEGIETLEFLMGQDGVGRADGDPVPQGQITADELRSMQADPRYWDSTRRDPAFVKKVEEGYQRLYGKG